MKAERKRFRLWLTDEEIEILDKLAEEQGIHRNDVVKNMVQEAITDGKSESDTKILH